MSALEHAYRYRHASFVSDDAQPRLTLATTDANGEEHPHFFEGRVLQPRLVAELLTAVHLIVGARFFTPANTLARILALADPVVTSGGGLLRFEGFSSCCSTYIRADLLPAAYDGEVVGKGTTNVDFNPPMRAALARVRDDAGLALSVGRDALSLRSGDTQVTERKVALPLRWLRGMVEVQSYQAGMRQRLEANAVEAMRFFRTLPKSSTSKTPLWVSRTAAGLVAGTRAGADAVRITDSTRLRVLQPLLPKARALRVYADEARQSSAWVLDFGDSRLTLVLSAEVWRGFSGEGQALWALMQAETDAVAAAMRRVRAQLQWQPALDAQALAAELALPPPTVADSLRVLGASGLAGFDVSSGHYFHRVLPFDLSAIDDMHPRLADARALLEADAAQVVCAAPFEATVSSGGVLHRVRDIDGELRCTCPWFAKHRGDRGPCKHALAAAVLRASA
jgi:SWIM zinc finger